MEGIEGVRAFDPVERNVFVGVGAWFEEISYNTGTQGTHEEFNIKAASASFWIVLHKDKSGDAVGGLGFGGGGKGRGRGLNKGPCHTLPCGEDGVKVRDGLGFSEIPCHG